VAVSTGALPSPRAHINEYDLDQDNPESGHKMRKLRRNPSLDSLPPGVRLLDANEPFRMVEYAIDIALVEAEILNRAILWPGIWGKFGFSENSKVYSDKLVQRRWIMKTMWGE
jgi:hypothetical protein